MIPLTQRGSNKPLSLAIHARGLGAPAWPGPAYSNQQQNTPLVSRADACGRVLGSLDAAIVLLA